MEHDNHGHSPAAWATVGILLIAFAMMSLAVAFPHAALFVAGVVVAVVGCVVGVVMARAGKGAKAVTARAHCAQSYAVDQR